MVMMLKQFSHRLEQEANAHGLSFLGYVFSPNRGLEGMMLEFGKPPDGAHGREVLTLPSRDGRAELHWIAGSGYDADRGRPLLQTLEASRVADRGGIAERLHATICQSLTAAHLQLELMLMSAHDDEVESARALVHQATTSVRELIDDLSGESA